MPYLERGARKQIKKNKKQNKLNKARIKEFRGPPCMYV